MGDVAGTSPSIISLVCSVPARMRTPIAELHDGSMPLRVLLVDDDARFRSVACRTLVEEGVEVVAEVGNGLDAAGRSHAAVPMWCFSTSGCRTSTVRKWRGGCKNRTLAW